MILSTFFYIALSVLGLGIVTGFFWILVWIIKRKEDRASYKKILNTDTVRTCLSPKEYLDAIEKMERQAKEDSELE